MVGLLGILILVLDQILWSTAPSHAYGLIVFVIVDFAAAGFVLGRPSRMALTIAAAWSSLRILIQLGDVFLGPTLGIGYADFANYLFNPVAVNPPNPAGIPGGLIDLIVIFQIMVISVALKGRSFA